MSEQGNQQQSQYIIAGSIVLAGLLIAGGIFLSNSEVGSRSADTEDHNQMVQDTPGAPSISIREITKDDKIVGSLDAPVIVVEYSDTECPFCKRFHETMNELMSNGELGPSGDIAWVYRHFPLDQLHPKARREAHATECAYEQGGNDAFWAYTNALYSITPANNGLNLEQLPVIAEQVGLDVDEFNECQESDRHAEVINADIEDARSAGGRGTPHNIIVAQETGNLFPLPGALPIDLMTILLETILEGTENGDDYETIVASINAALQ